MADQKNPNNIISPDELSPQDQAILQQAAAQGEAALEHAIGRLELEKHGQLPDAYKKVEFYNQSPQPPKTSQTQGIAGAGNILGSIIGAAGRLATMDTSGASTIVSNINDKALEKQMGELFGDGGPLHDIQDPEEIQKKLQEIDPNKLLENQFNELHGRLEGAGADEDTIKRLEKEHALLKPKTEQRKPENRSEEKWREKQDKEFRKRLSEVDKSNKSVDEKRAQKQQIIQQHVRARLKQKLGQNNKHFDKLLARRFFGIGGRSTIPKFKKKVLHDLKKEREAKWKELAQQRKAAQKQQRLLRHFPRSQFLRPEAIRISFPEAAIPVAPAATTTQSPPTQQSPSLPLLTPKGVPGQKKVLSLLLKQPWFWWIVGGALFIILIIVIVIAINSSSDCGLYCPIPLTQIACNNIQYGKRIGDDGETIFKATNDYFQVNFVDGTPTDTSGKGKYNGKDQRVATALYGSVCLLFGLYAPDSKKGVFNTFGQLVTGVNIHEGQYDAPTIRLAQDPSLVDDNGNLTCGSTYDQKRMVIFNPEACLTPNMSATTSNPAGLASPKLQFVVAKSLAYMLIAEQKKSTGKQADVLQQFETLPSSSGPHGSGIMGQDGLLPTSDCQQGEDHETLWKDLGYGPEDTDLKQQDCFTDMVGAYLTYPFYFEGAPSSADALTPPLTQAPSPTTAPAAATTSTPRPSIISSPLSDFPNSPYKDYYLFAKTNLFDNKVFFLINSDVVANAQFITSKLVKSTCTYGQLNGQPYPDTGFYDEFTQIVDDKPKPNNNPPPAQITSDSGYVVKARGTATDPDTTNECLGVRYWCTHLIIDAFAMAGIKDLAENELADNLVAVVNMRQFFIDHSGPGGNLTFIPYYNHPISSLGENDYLTNIYDIRPGDVMFEVDDTPLVNGKRDIGASKDHHVVLVDKVVWPDDISEQIGNGTIYYYESNNNSDVYGSRGIYHKKIDESWQIIGFGRANPSAAPTATVTPGK